MIGGHGSYYFADFAGRRSWGSGPERPPVDAASPNESEIDMLEFLAEAGERRLREEAALEVII